MSQGNIFRLTDVRRQLLFLQEDDAGGKINETSQAPKELRTHYRHSTHQIIKRHALYDLETVRGGVEWGEGSLRGLG